MEWEVAVGGPSVLRVRLRRARSAGACTEGRPRRSNVLLVAASCRATNHNRQNGA